MIAFLYIGLIVVAFFLLIVLPQRRQMAAHRALVAALAPGDEIITTGGIHGTIRSLDDRVIELDIAEGVVIRLARNAVSQKVVPGGSTGELSEGESAGEPARGSTD